MTRPNDASLARARRILATCGVVDLHVDSIIQHTLFGYDLRKRHRAGVKGQPLFWHADIPRMLEASYRCANLGIHYFPRETANGVRTAHNQIDAVDRIAEADPACIRIRNADDWARCKPGTLGLVPGVEGAHMLNGDIQNLHDFCDRGIAYLTLAHFSKNAAATPSLGREANEDDGLTTFGRDVVDVLNRRGVVIDVSHLNQRCAIEAAEQSDAPVFATHSGAQGVFPHARLLSDAAIDAVAASGGAIGVIFGPGFLAGKAKASSEVVADHIDYIVQRVGVAHVVMGSDYDGWLPRILSDHRDCRDIDQVAAALVRRDYSESDIVDMFSRNAERVARDAWAARQA